MTPQAILFDFDGVLIESEESGNRHIAEYLTRIGHPTTPAQSMATFMGLSGMVNVGQGAVVLGFAAEPAKFE